MVSGAPKDWSLHPQLERDTIAVGDLALARVLLANDANYPWLIQVPRRPGLTEIIDLEANQQIQFMGEIDAAARVLKAVTECEKLNIAAIGKAISSRNCMCTWLHAGIATPPGRSRCGALPRRPRTTQSSAMA